MKDLGYGKGYRYAHDYPNNFIQQDYLPDNVSQSRYYEPTTNGEEVEISKRLNIRWGFDDKPSL
jgi:putative ATPase